MIVNTAQIPVINEIDKKFHSKYRIPKQKVYFAHNMSTYGTGKEFKELLALKIKFCDCEIINPADYEEEWENLTREERMARCYELIRSSAYLVFSGIFVTDFIYYIGKGVYDEVIYAKKKKKKVYYLNKDQNGFYRLTRDFNVNTKHIVDWTYYAIVNVIVEDITIRRQIVNTIQNKHLSALFLPVGHHYETFILNNLLQYSLQRCEQLFIFTPYNDYFFRKLRDFFLKLPRTNSFNWLISFLFGKRNYCLKYASYQEIDCTECEFKQKVEKLNSNDEYYILEDLVQSLPNFYKISDIKGFLKEYGCPYFFFVNSAELVDICITNHAYLKTTNNRLLFLDRMLKSSFQGKNFLVFDTHLFGPVTESTLEINRLKNIVSVTKSRILTNYLNLITNMKCVPRDEDLRSELEKEYKKLPKMNPDNPLEKDFEHVYDFFNVLTELTIFNNKLNRFEKIELHSKPIFRFLVGPGKTVLVSNKMYPRPFFEDYHGLDLYYKLKLPFNNGNFRLIAHQRPYNIFELLKTIHKLNDFGNTLFLLKNKSPLYLKDLESSGYTKLRREKIRDLSLTIGKSYYYIDENKYLDLFFLLNGANKQFKIIIIEDLVLLSTNFPKFEYDRDILKTKQDFKSFYLSNYQCIRRLLSIIDLNIQSSNDFSVIIVLPSILYLLLESRLFITTKSSQELESVINAFWRGYSVF